MKGIYEMKRNLLAIAILALAASAANASGIEGGVVVGAGASAFGGSVSGSASSISNGNAVTAAQVGGTGKSFQSANGSTGGTAMDAQVRGIVSAMKDRPFIFNLGHGVMQPTRPDECR